MTPVGTFSKIQAYLLHTNQKKLNNSIKSGSNLKYLSHSHQHFKDFNIYQKISLDNHSHATGFCLLDRKGDKFTVLLLQYSNLSVYQIKSPLESYDTILSCYIISTDPITVALLSKEGYFMIIDISNETNHGFTSNSSRNNDRNNRILLLTSSSSSLSISEHSQSYYQKNNQRTNVGTRLMTKFICKIKAGEEDSGLFIVGMTIQEYILDNRDHSNMSVVGIFTRSDGKSCKFRISQPKEDIKEEKQIIIVLSIAMGDDELNLSPIFELDHPTVLQNSNNLSNDEMNSISTNWVIDNSIRKHVLGVFQHIYSRIDGQHMSIVTLMTPTSKSLRVYIDMGDRNGIYIGSNSKNDSNSDSESEDDGEGVWRNCDTDDEDTINNNLNTDNLSSNYNSNSTLKIMSRNKFYSIEMDPNDQWRPIEWIIEDHGGLLINCEVYSSMDDMTSSPSFSSIKSANSHHHHNNNSSNDNSNNSSTSNMLNDNIGAMNDSVVIVGLCGKDILDSILQKLVNDTSHMDTIYDIWMNNIISYISPYISTLARQSNDDRNSDTNTNTKPPLNLCIVTLRKDSQSLHFYSTSLTNSSVDKNSNYIDTQSLILSLDLNKLINDLLLREEDSLSISLYRCNHGILNVRGDILLLSVIGVDKNQSTDSEPSVHRKLIALTIGKYPIQMIGNVNVLNHQIDEEIIAMIPGNDSISDIFYVLTSYSVYAITINYSDITTDMISDSITNNKINTMSSSFINKAFNRIVSSTFEQLIRYIDIHRLETNKESLQNSCIGYPINEIRKLWIDVMEYVAYMRLLDSSSGHDSSNGSYGDVDNNNNNHNHSNEIIYDSKPNFTFKNVNYVSDTNVDANMNTNGMNQLIRRLVVSIISDSSDSHTSLGNISNSKAINSFSTLDDVQMSHLCSEICVAIKNRLRSIPVTSKIDGIRRNPMLFSLISTPNSSNTSNHNSSEHMNNRKSIIKNQTIENNLDEINSFPYKSIYNMAIILFIRSKSMTLNHLHTESYILELREFLSDDMLSYIDICTILPFLFSFGRISSSGIEMACDFCIKTHCEWLFLFESCKLSKESYSSSISISIKLNLLSSILSSIFDRSQNEDDDKLLYSQKICIEKLLFEIIEFDCDYLFQNGMMTMMMERLISIKEIHSIFMNIIHRIQFISYDCSSNSADATNIKAFTNLMEFISSNRNLHILQKLVSLFITHLHQSFTEMNKKSIIIDMNIIELTVVSIMKYIQLCRFKLFDHIMNDSIAFNDIMLWYPIPSYLLEPTIISQSYESNPILFLDPFEVSNNTQSDLTNKLFTILRNLLQYLFWQSTENQSNRLFLDELRQIIMSIEGYAKDLNNDEIITQIVRYYKHYDSAAISAYRAIIKRLDLFMKKSGSNDCNNNNGNNTIVTITCCQELWLIFHNHLEETIVMNSSSNLQGCCILLHQIWQAWKHYHLPTTEFERLVENSINRNSKKTVDQMIQSEGFGTAMYACLRIVLGLANQMEYRKVGLTMPIDSTTKDKDDQLSGLFLYKVITN